VAALAIRELLRKIGKEYFYLMHLSWEGRDRERLWDFAVKKKVIGLDHYRRVNVNRRWDQFPEKQKKKVGRKWRTQFELFAKMQNDDCVLVFSGKTHLLGIGLSRDPYLFKPELTNFFRHVRNVSWLLKYEWQDRTYFPLRAFSNTISYVDESSRYWKIVDRRVRLQRSVSLDTRVQARKSARRRSEQLRRKYGAGGEGSSHRKLKDWIFKNPHALGLKGVLRRHKEYPLASGDRADVVFDLMSDRYAVVEIETDSPIVGVHQALKYKVLKCAEAGLDIKSARVAAYLVAWNPPEDTSFSQRYNIRFVRKKL